MANCFEERVLIALKSRIEAALLGSYGAGPTCQRTFTDMDPENVPVGDTPMVYIIEAPGRRLCDTGNGYDTAEVPLLVSILTRVAEGNQGVLSAAANNAQSITERAIFESTFIVESASVAAFPSGAYGRENGRVHAWVDIPVMLHIPYKS